MLVIKHIVVLRMCVTLKRKLESVLYVGLKTELAELESAARVLVHFCHLQAVQRCSASGRGKPLVLVECSSSACLA